MKKIAVCFCLFCCVNLRNTAHADYNPFFGENKNQIVIMVGQGFDQGFLVPPPFRIVPFYVTQIQYSQPTTFFRLPARQSINLAQTIGSGTKYGWHWDSYSIPIIFLTEDVALLNVCDWYFGVGAGGGLQAHQNARMGSKWLFEFKIMTGYRFTDAFGAEFYVQHFSNGNTASDNHSYAFYGLGLTYSF